MIQPNTQFFIAHYFLEDMSIIHFVSSHSQGAAKELALRRALMIIDTKKILIVDRSVALLIPTLWFQGSDRKYYGF